MHQIINDPMVGSQIYCGLARLVRDQPSKLRKRVRFSQAAPILCTGGRVIMLGAATSVYVGLNPTRYSNYRAFGIAAVHLAFNQT